MSEGKYVRLDSKVRNANNVGRTRWHTIRFQGTSYLTTDCGKPYMKRELEYCDKVDDKKFLCAGCIRLKKQLKNK